MADRPIIFSAPMIRALLDGRKAQTRRVLPKAHPRCPHHNQIRMDVLAFDPQSPEVWYWDGVHDRVGASFKIPYAPGDRLWVREAFWTCEDCGYCNHVVGANSAGVGDRKSCAACDTMLPKPKTSPIFMPRYNSRLTLTVTDVRVQRLQDISEADAVAEGCRGFVSRDGEDGLSPLEEYRDLWNSIHGPNAWNANPWVCAITFDVTRGNIDASKTAGGDHV